MGVSHRFNQPCQEANCPFELKEKVIGRKEARLSDFLDFTGWCHSIVIQQSKRAIFLKPKTERPQGLQDHGGYFLSFKRRRALPGFQQAEPDTPKATGTLPLPSRAIKYGSRFQGWCFPSCRHMMQAERLGGEGDILQKSLLKRCQQSHHP